MNFLRLIIIIVLLCVPILVVSTRLDTNIPSLRIRFVASDPEKTQKIEYQYFYQGSDSIRGAKFGGYGHSDTHISKTGQIIEIPSKRIISYWPFSQFTYVLLQARNSSELTDSCVWNASIWSDAYDYLLDEHIKKKESIARFPYEIQRENEYTFQMVKDQIVEIKCL